jgi:hypothetical protein
MSVKLAVSFRKHQYFPMFSRVVHAWQGGTTVAVAERLGRRFVGIDQSAIAVKVTELRLQKQGGHFETIKTNTTDDRSYRPQVANIRYNTPSETQTIFQ